MRVSSGALAAAVCVSLAAPVHAAPLSAVPAWLCANLKRPFDPQAAIKAFPLEPVGDVEETRTMDANGAHVTFAAKGEQYLVEYRYSFRVDDVTSKYGYTLSYRPLREITGRAESAAAEKQAKAMLSEFGKLEDSRFGWRVTGGPLMNDLIATFAFTSWGAGKMGAEWWDADDVRRAATLCPKAEAPPPSSERDTPAK
jgi:hypothetical protein